MKAFLAWLGRQSLPRLLGIFVSNTRDLEARLVEKDAEIERLRSDIGWYQNQYVALTDSFLLSRGNRPTVAASATAEPTEKPVVFATTEKLAIEIEADKLAELLLFDPKEMSSRVEDLQKSNRPRDKEILRKLDLRLAEMPLSDGPSDGVVITN